MKSDGFFDKNLHIGIDGRVDFRLGPVHGLHNEQEADIQRKWRTTGSKKAANTHLKALYMGIQPIPHNGYQLRVDLVLMFLIIL